jgi:hypothetical protein
MWRLLNLCALGFATAVTLVLVAAVVIDSPNLQNFDLALLQRKGWKAVGDVVRRDYYCGVCSLS